MANQLANELSGIGINLNENQVDSIAQAIGKGGSAGMAIARLIVENITEMTYANSHTGGDDPSKKNVTKLTTNQLDSLLLHLRSGNRLTLPLTRYLVPKIEAVKKTQQNNSYPKRGG